MSLFLYLSHIDKYVVQSVKHARSWTSLNQLMVLLIVAMFMKMREMASMISSVA